MGCRLSVVIDDAKRRKQDLLAEVFMQVSSLWPVGLIDECMPPEMIKNFSPDGWGRQIPIPVLKALMVERICEQGGLSLFPFDVYFANFRRSAPPEREQIEGIVDDYLRKNNPNCLPRYGMVARDL